MDMNYLGNLVVALFMFYYSFYFIKLLVKKNRMNIKTTNLELDKIRKIPIKDLETQKKFIDMKYPKSPNFKFHWKMIRDIVIYILIFAIFMRIYYFIFDILHLKIDLWIAILFVMIIPILINIILSKFNLQQKSDLISIFKKY
jgi:hypothetical protein